MKYKYDVLFTMLVLMLVGSSITMGWFMRDYYVERESFEGPGRFLTRGPSVELAMEKARREHGKYINVVLCKGGALLLSFPDSNGKSKFKKSCDMGVTWTDLEIKQ